MPEPMICRTVDPMDAFELSVAALARADDKVEVALGTLVFAIAATTLSARASGGPFDVEGAIQAFGPAFRDACKAVEAQFPILTTPLGGGRA